MRHHWTEQDDLMILFVSQFGFGKSPLTRQQMAERLGVSVGSVSYRLGNFAAIKGAGKATHYARLSQEVYDKYSNLSIENLKNLAFQNVSDQQL